MSNKNIKVKVTIIICMSIITIVFLYFSIINKYENAIRSQFINYIRVEGKVYLKLIDNLLARKYNELHILSNGLNDENKIKVQFDLSTMKDKSSFNDIILIDKNKKIHSSNEMNEEILSNLDLTSLAIKENGLNLYYSEKEGFYFLYSIPIFFQNNLYGNLIGIEFSTNKQSNSDYRNYNNSAFAVNENGNSIHYDLDGDMKFYKNIFEIAPVINELRGKLEGEDRKAVSIKEVDENIYASVQKLSKDSNWSVITFKDFNMYKNTFKKSFDEMKRVFFLMSFITLSIIFYLSITLLSIKRKLEKKIYKETITGLPSIVEFKESGNKLINSNNNRNFVLLEISIDDFYLVDHIDEEYDSNNILVHISEVLVNELKDEELIAKGEDAIYYMLLTYKNKSDLEKRVKRIHKEIRRNGKFKFFYGGFSVSYGLALGKDIDDIELLINEATIARENNKKSDSLFQIYSDDIKKNLVEEKYIECKMYSALSNREFKVYIQPKYNINTGKIIGGEALVRWENIEKGIIMPGTFIPVLERCGFIVDLDMFIFEEVCKYQNNLRNNGSGFIPISVNFSREHFKNPKNFIKRLLEISTAYGIENELIEIEITESLQEESDFEFRRIIKNIKDYNINIALDDFGAGYSSLNNLSKLQLDTIKIDRAFIVDLNRDEKSNIVLKNILSMCFELNINVVVEGIETKEQVDFLKEQGCEAGQGFYYSKAVTIDEFNNLINEG